MPNVSPVRLLLAGRSDVVASWRAALAGRETLALLPDLTRKEDWLRALAAKPEALLVDGKLFANAGDLIGHLIPLTASTYVVLPDAASEDDRNAVSAVAGVKGIHAANLNLTKLARRIVHDLRGDEVAPTAVDERSVSRSATAVPAHDGMQQSDRLAPPRRVRVRLGFYGARGGVGASTAALKVARLLATEGLRVVLFDSRRRGDLHLMLGASPCEQPYVHTGDDTHPGSITLSMGAPAEETVGDFDAVIVDGGRAKGIFNADWVEISRPLSDRVIGNLVGLESAEERGRRALSMRIFDVLRARREVPA